MNRMFEMARAPTRPPLLYVILPVDAAARTVVGPVRPEFVRGLRPLLRPPAGTGLFLGMQLLSAPLLGAERWLRRPVFIPLAMGTLLANALLLPVRAVLYIRQPRVLRPHQRHVRHRALGHHRRVATRMAVSQPGLSGVGQFAAAAVFGGLSGLDLRLPWVWFAACLTAVAGLAARKETAGAQPVARQAKRLPASGGEPFSCSDIVNPLA